MSNPEKIIAAQKSDWKTSEMPAQHTTFIIERKISPSEMEKLKLGNIPQEMEDKWFWYFENGKLYAHRSWTGFCIYILSFTSGSDRIEVTANRDPEQYRCTDDVEDAKTLNKLLDWWTKPTYDYYHEWLAETLDNLNKQKKESVIQIKQDDITTLDCECIVNAANKSLLGGGGVDGAIHRAAGPELLRECRTLGGCETGEAKITQGYRLPAKWVIHTVGPIYSGRAKDAELLANCYRNSLELARTHDIHSIAFPAISTGVYGYPLKAATAVAMSTVKKWLDDNRDYFMEVIFCCFNKQAYDIYQSYAAENKI